MALSHGDPMKDAQCVIGPMVAKESGPRINAMIDDALAKGARLACGGHAEGAVMPATIVDHVKPGMKIFDEETFGPITTVVRINGVDEAVSVANDTAYGLSAGVFGRDVTRALGVALQIDTGSCHVNGATVQNEAQAPYGGTKDSGYGRFDGRAVIDEFTELKWITLEPSVQQYPV
jgi:acyl-CoA reductase-like NAD-dependent aldehyde dehydrogenase